MDVSKDYYAALGVAKDADASAIKKAYRKLARDLHPDKNPGNTEAEARFKEVSEAYDVLSNPQTRAKYDEDRDLFGRGFRPGAGGGPGGPGGPGGATFDMSDLFGGSGGGANLGDLFSDLFGGAAGGARGGRSGPTRGQDVSAEITLDFEQAVDGATLPLQLSGPGTCRTCHGSGARPGTGTHRCPVCGGTGSLIRNQGGFAFSEPCRECRGTGTVVESPCPDCGGSGVTNQTRTISVRIPAGVRNGARLRIPGKGTPGTNGGRTGDLFVTVHVNQHGLFGRKGEDLTLTVPISYPEAALGTTLRVPTLNGGVSLKVPAGTPSGRTLRVRGRGIARAGKPGRHGKTGDLLVTVEVAVPKKVSGEAREALTKYAAATGDDDPRPQISAALRQMTPEASHA